MTMPQPGKQAPRRRGQVLRLLQNAAGPMAITEIAERLGIHVNSARSSSSPSADTMWCALSTWA